MKRYTKADMEKFRHDEFGNLICPTGDYSKIRRFGAGCSFGEDCGIETHEHSNAQDAIDEWNWEMQ